MTLVRGGDEGGRDPAVEPADDTFSIVAQEFDELCWFSGSKVKTLIRVVTSFVTAIVVFMMFSSKKRCSLSLHHEDDPVNHNGSVGQKKMWIPQLRDEARDHRKGSSAQEILDRGARLRHRLRLPTLKLRRAATDKMRFAERSRYS